MKCITISLFAIIIVLVPYAAFAQNIEYVGSYGPFDNARTVLVSGNHAFVADGDLKIVDVTDPTAPAPSGAIVTPGFASGVFISGNYAYVADGDSGLQIISIIDPTNPTVIATYRDTLEAFNNVFVLGDYAYVVGLTGTGTGLIIINVSDVSNPFFVGQFKDDDAWYHLARFIDVFVSENFAYVGAQGSNYLFGYENFEIIDVTNPSNPIYMGAFSPGSFRAYAHLGIFISGHGFLVGHYGLSIIEISDPTSPALIGTYDTPGLAQNVLVSGNYAYIADGDTGLEIVDISTPSNPMPAGSYNTPGSAHDIYISGDYIYVADSSSLQILRFTTTGIRKDDRLPNDFSLSQNYPNPFNTQTTVQYSLATQSLVSIDIFDILGRKIETFTEGIKPAGNHQATWDASGQASGIYFYRIKAGDKVETKRMTLMK
jgi:hypothetical protein